MQFSGRDVPDWWPHRPCRSRTSLAGRQAAATSTIGAPGHDHRCRPFCQLGGFRNCGRRCLVSCKITKSGRRASRGARSTAPAHVGGICTANGAGRLDTFSPGSRSPDRDRRRSSTTRDRPGANALPVLIRYVIIGIVRRWGQDMIDISWAKHAGARSLPGSLCQRRRRHRSSALRRAHRRTSPQRPVVDHRAGPE